MSAIVNTTPSQLDFLGCILERLNGTVTQVSQLRQSLGNLEIELIEIRNQCENARAAAAATAKPHNGDRNAIIQNAPAPGGHPGPVPLQNPEMNRNPIVPSREQNVIRRRPETPKSELEHDPKSKPVRKSAGLSTKTKPGHSPSPLPSSANISSSLHILGGLWSQTGCAIKAENSLEVSRPWFRTRSAQPVQGVAMPGPVRKHAKKPLIATQTSLPPPLRPPTQPSPFPEDINLSSYPPGLKSKGDDWFVLYNLSPKVKRVLDVNVVHTLKHNSSVTCAKFSRDGKWLATGCWRSAQIYDVETGIKTHILDHEDDVYIESISFSPDGKYLATGGRNNQVTVWDIANQQIHNILKGHQGTVYSLHFSPNGQFIVSGSFDGTVRIWDVHDRTFKVLTIDGHYLSLDHRVASVAISPDGRYVAVGSMDTVVSIWEITTGVQVQRLRGHMKVVRSVAFTPDGKGLISGSNDATLKYWDVSGLGIGSGASAALTSTSIASSSPCLMNLPGHKDEVYSTAVSHDGTWIVSGSDDGNVIFWDTRTGMAQCMLSGHTNGISGVDLSPIGNFLATADWDGKVRIWSYGAL